MKVTILGIVTIFLVVWGNAVEGRDLLDEDSILETQLKNISKPAIKTIQVKFFFLKKVLYINSYI